jgi:hypothetical protein
MKLPADNCRPLAKLPIVRGSGDDTKAVAGCAHAALRAAMRFCSLVHFVRYVSGIAMHLVSGRSWWRLFAQTISRRYTQVTEGLRKSQQCRVRISDQTRSSAM